MARLAGAASAGGGYSLLGLRIGQLRFATASGALPAQRCRQFVGRQLFGSPESVVL